jgi:outer membrane protein OmpA-like peptidoglycan-associated protein
MRKIFRETLPVLLMAAIQGCGSGGGTPVPSSTANAAGGWRGEAGVSGVAVPASLRLTQAGADVTGDLEVRGNPDLTGPVQGTMQGNSLKLRMLNGMSITPLTVGGDHITGVISVGPVWLQRVPGRPVAAAPPAAAPPAAAPPAAAPPATFTAVHFAPGKSEIPTDEMVNIAKVADYMKQHAGAFVMLDGHADPRGTNAYNAALSQRRADAVRDALVQAGVPAERITTVASGEGRPVCTEQTEACLQAKRRVEVYVRTDRESYPAGGVKGTR